MGKFQIKNLKCVMTGKTCWQHKPECPLYQNSDRYSYGKIQIEDRCRYQGIMRWMDGLRLGDFVEASGRRGDR